MRFPAGLAALLALAGCTTVPSLPPVADPDAAWRAHRARVETLQRFELEARIAVRSPDNGGSGSLSWQQDGEQYRLQAAGPLGRGAVRIEGLGEWVRWRSADGGGEGRALGVALPGTGVALPLVPLRYWVRGLPAPAGVPQVTVNESGQLGRLQQDGWQVEFSGYENGPPVALPRRIVLTREEVVIRMVIDQWRTEGLAPLEP